MAAPTNPTNDHSHSRQHSKHEGGSTVSRPHYEWMGPPGALFIMLSLPLVIYALYFLCERQHCLSRTATVWPWQSAHCDVQPAIAAQPPLPSRR